MSIQSIQVMILFQTPGTHLLAIDPEFLGSKVFFKKKLAVGFFPS